MTEQLYIDGVLVDVGENTDITLSIRSNILSDISKIGGNSTYTIKLPKTTKNRAIFGYADKMDNDEDFAYKTHKADFYRNGVELIHGGTATLQSSQEDYEISIAWGCRTKFDALVSVGQTLRDLSDDSSLVFERMPHPTQYNTFIAQGYGYLLLETSWEGEVSDDWHGETVFAPWDGTNTGFPVARSEESGTGTRAQHRMIGYPVNNHPCATVSWILGRIASEMGVQFQWTGDAAVRIAKLCIPCITKEATKQTYGLEAFTAGVSLVGDETLGFTITRGGVIFPDPVGSEVNSLTVAVDSEAMIDISITMYVTAQNLREGRKRLKWLQRLGYEFIAVQLIVTHTNNDVERMRIGADSTMIESAQTESGLAITFHSRGIVKLAVGDVVTAKLLRRTFLFWRLDGVVTGNMSVSAADGKEVPYGGYFPIEKNLPNIKVIDFVKFLCAITGTFAVQNSNDGIVSFAAYNDVDLSNALDWSGRLVASSGSNVADKVSYRISSEWAQHNYYCWKDDERAPVIYDGDLSVPDGTVQAERDVITFPFAASANKDNAMAIVPMYTRKETYDDDGNLITDVDLIEYDYDKCEPRILSFDGLGTSLVNTQFDINMQTVINEKYGILRGMLNKCKVIEEEIRLTAIEIKQFDETRPIWLRQYGQYFLVLEIQSGANDIAKVKLVQL